ncbi:ESX-1 secretion-associated protein [Mycobacterium sp. EPG1]|nr:ESX-1 secretion-associated protein [Mycobacterium sp. EPG1]
MTEPLSVDPHGLRSLADVHAGVATGLGALGASAPGSAPLAASHGPIAAAVDTALAGTLGRRSRSVAGAQTAGETIAELLHQAALAYERGDEHGGDAISAAADRMTSAPEVAAATAAPGPPGADALGQAVGQLGQLGALGQQLAAPLAALAPALLTLPAQLASGLAQTGVPEETGSGTTGLADKAPSSAEAVETPEAEDTGEPARDDTDEAARDDTDEREPATAPPGQAAPVTPVAPRPAPTRPAL